jgi:hypothetical protein
MPLVLFGLDLRNIHPSLIPPKSLNVVVCLICPHYRNSNYQREAKEIIQSAELQI